MQLVILPVAGQQRALQGEKLRLVQYAQQFLVNQGFDPEKLQLRFEKVTPNLVFFNNPETRLFILVARDKVAPLLHERTLAFSMGSTWAEGVDDSGIEGIFSYYDSTLTKMRKGEIPAEKTFPREEARRNVAALLKYTKWRQFRLTPNRPFAFSGCWTGCGPTAVAQVMKFYAYPKDLIDWSQTQPKYPYPTGDTLSITPLLSRIGDAVKVEYGADGTSTSMEGIREALMRDFGYSSRMIHLYHEVAEREMLRLVEEDILAGRPSLMCGFNHIFVCDGLCRDFYHLNMGWGGNYDGWYRFITPQAHSKRGSLLDGVLVNIVPADATDSILHDLHFEEAGSLAALPVEQLGQMARLKISGPINGADLHILRHMAGSMMNDTIRGWFGRLYDLDLSDAEIVEDTAYYYDYNADEANFRTTWRDKEYHFDHMTHKLWLEIAETPAAHNQWYDIEERVPDRQYKIHLKTEDDVVGHSLFYSCHTLRYLCLPRATRRIDRYAFFFCPMLEQVSMPDSTSTLFHLDNTFPTDCKIELYR